jgi:hypothetical protein
MDEVLACRPLGPKPIRGPNIGDRRSISRAELQITVTVDCLDADLVLFALPVHGQLDRDPGCAPAPQCAIEVRQIANLRPVDRDDPIGMLDSRAGSRAFRSDAAHHELTTDLLQIGAEPRPRRGRTSKRDQIAALGMRHLPRVRLVRRRSGPPPAFPWLPARCRVACGVR